MDDSYRRQLEVAEHAAVEAGRLLRRAFGTVEAREKGPSDLVTEADLASQRAIAAILLGAFPEHTLLAEEDGVVADATNPWRWIVDPMDGTINFAHGNPLWCVSIALEHKGEIVVGVVHTPILGTTHIASKGQGARVDGRPIQVSTAPNLRSSLISCGMPTNFAADAPRQMGLMARFSTGTHSVRRTGTSAWNLAQVASGGLDAYYSTSNHAWDVAAGVLLVREAGGRVTTLEGGPYVVDDPLILATNGRIHDEAVGALAEAVDWHPGEHRDRPSL